MPRIPTQLIPLAILFAGGIVALVVARQALVPDSFGDYGHYRADAVQEIQSQEIVYAGYHVCAECHDDIMEEKNDSHHSGLSCEVCLYLCYSYKRIIYTLLESKPYII